MTSIYRALNIARTGLHAMETNLAVKAQNLSAQGVPGFKRVYLTTLTLPFQDLDMVGAGTSEAGTVTPTGIQIGTGVKVGGTYRSFRDGDPITTDRALDVMIRGEGFFQVRMPDGTISYTRAGVFGKAPDGTIVTIPTGYIIEPGIAIPTEATSISISEGGQVYVQMPGKSDPVNIGRFEIATFVNPSGLKAIGNSMFLATAASGEPKTGGPQEDNRGELVQGTYEGANVDIVEEVTDLIKIQRIYEMLTKVYKAGDEMWQSVASSV